MELNIKLIGNIGRLNKREPFIIADNEKLVLNFSCATPLTDYYIELKNGDKSAKYRLSSVSSYEVPKELFHAGTLEVTVSLLGAPNPIAVKFFGARSRRIVAST